MIKSYAFRGIVVKAPMCDVSNEQVLQQVFKDLAQTMPLIKGCIQRSIVLRDGLLDLMSTADWNAVLRPKTQGTLKPCNSLAKRHGLLDYFCRLLALYLAHAVKQIQPPTLSWTPWQASSLLRLGTNAALRRNGFGGLSMPELFALLDYACDPNCPRAVNSQRAKLIAGLSSAITLPPERFESVYWTGRPVFRRYQMSIGSPSSTNRIATRTRKRRAMDGFSTAADEAAATEIALKELVANVASLLNVPVTDIEVRKPLHTFGIDSPVSLEIRYWISKELKAEVSIFGIMQASGLAELAGLVLDKSVLRK